MKKQKYVLKMVLSALFLALTYILPYITGQLQEFGSMLCPMHIPVLLCGFICGWQWGLVIGFTAPLFRSAVAGMPIMFPSAVCMAFELAVYGALSGIAYKLLPKKKIYTYVSLLISMVSGRIIWGIAMLTCMNIKGGGFTFSAFISGAFLNSIPGIVLQIVLVPLIVMTFEKLMKNSRKEESISL